MSPPAEGTQIRFLMDIQRILGEGLFTATYKYALLIALSNLAVERGDDEADPVTFTTSEIAEHLIRLYWPQTSPYPMPGNGHPLVLQQNKGAEATVIRDICRLQRTCPEPLGKVAHLAKHAWLDLLKRVERTVRVMPLTKLQTVGEQQLEFLYTISDDRRRVVLKPGVAFCLRRFHGIVCDLARGAWVAFVRRRNTAALGAATDLADFLFPGSRASLATYAPILRDVQKGVCIYCRRPLGRAVEVDHFVPWSRYPTDIGENLVLTDRSCNQQKAEHLASEECLEAWASRNMESSAELQERLRARILPTDPVTARCIAIWAYGHVEKAGGQLWVPRAGLRPITDRWRRVLCA